ncbi:hypothetical protein Droror1_Dr00019528 [Drosera rotundifolia]
MATAIADAAATMAAASDDERAGAEIAYGCEECLKHIFAILEEMGFPKGILPLKDLVECGRVRATGFVWMKQKKPSEHYFERAKTLVSYGEEVTAYVEVGKMRKMTGVKSKPVFFWFPLTVAEMSIVDDPNGKEIYFKSSLGVGKECSITAFMTEEERIKFKEIKDGKNDDVDNDRDGDNVDDKVKTTEEKSLDD